jgi:beta-galactosidase
MRRSLFLVIFLSFGVYAQQVVINDYENQKVVGINKQAYHVNVIPHADLLDALAHDPSLSPYYKNLNGIWKFNWSPKPADAPQDFFKHEFDISDWKDIKVPGTIELQGFGNAVFKNIKQLTTPPTIPTDYNPVGSYRTTFHIPEDWSGRQTFINFDGVESAFYIWVNGKKVGYSENTYSPAEFNITKYLKPGENTLALQVYSYSDGSYLENHNAWRMSGIFRDVYLYSKNPASIRDFKIETDFGPDYKDANLFIRLDVRNLNPKDKMMYKAEFSLYNAADKLVLVDKSPLISLGNPASTFIDLKRKVAEPFKWNSENPYLYTLIITFKNEKGFIMEMISTRIGFRKVKIKDGILQLNGQPMLIRGVKRQEHDMHTGKYVMRESMLNDIKLMKQFNINAVSNSYPNASQWYDLCDEYGIYVCDEANLETGNLREKLAKDSLWTAAFMDRVYSLKERDKNHPSVILWSLGNESGFGSNFIKMSDWLHKNDLTRPVLYNQANRDASIDIIASSYAGVENYKANARDDKRPAITSEYAPAIGNSVSNLKGFWAITYGMPKAHGGFVGDWVDQGFVKKTAEDQIYFTTEIRDSLSRNFSAFGGMVLPDRNIQPELFELKYLAQPIRIMTYHLPIGKIKIKNWFESTNINKLDVKWELKEGGNVMQFGNLSDLDIGPGEEKSVQVPFTQPTPKPGQEYWLNISCKLREATSWAFEGHEVAYEQFKLPLSSYVPMTKYNEDDLNFKFNESPEAISILGTTFKMIFSKTTGNLTSFNFKGTEMLKSGPEASFWRAPTSNDATQLSDTNQAAAKWKQYGLHHIISRLNSIHALYLKKGVFEVVVKQDLTAPEFASFIENTFTYTILSSGDVFLNHHVDVKKNMPDLDKYGFARVGLQMVVPKGFETFAWHGKGPWEGYSDRKESGTVGIYKSTVDEQYFPYGKPQANGNNPDVRWAILADSNGRGLAVYGAPVFETSALHYSDQSLEVKSTADVKRSDDIFWHIDYKQSGLGDAAHGTGVRPEHRVPVQSYNYYIHFKPINTNYDSPEYFATDVPRVKAPILHAEIKENVFTGKFTLESPTPGAEIRYTLDGTEPTTKSSLYSVPFKIGKFDIKAKAFKVSLLSSEGVSYSKDFLLEKYAGNASSVE